MASAVEKGSDQCPNIESGVTANENVVAMQRMHTPSRDKAGKGWAGGAGAKESKNRHGVVIPWPAAYCRRRDNVTVTIITQSVYPQPPEDGELFGQERSKITQEKNKSPD